MPAKYYSISGVRYNGIQLIIVDAIKKSGLKEFTVEDAYLCFLEHFSFFAQKENITEKRVRKAFDNYQRNHHALYKIGKSRSKATGRPTTLYSFNDPDEKLKIAVNAVGDEIKGIENRIKDEAKEKEEMTAVEFGDKFLRYVNFLNQEIVRLKEKDMKHYEQMKDFQTNMQFLRNKLRKANKQEHILRETIQKMRKEKKKQLKNIKNSPTFKLGELARVSS